MELVKVFDITTGDYIMEYDSNIVPRIGDTLFIGELQTKVANVCHIISEELVDEEEVHELSHFEVEVKIIG